ncbi:hypothetical protein Aple_033150 [Acrocarpospora pleiomorpha]|uniref:Uncharacterized protein n=1 Tax=Acrocarpospora pleiomorpha TaxID=90975 RepID=A0A5M3XJV2_9ACTN|nr:hypothetical protein [Acrocarpospora pleiomorpha]GES20419.1 hypothetical protein Aple_033150 [Acrocarpospora pleiomorpha]
MNTIDHRPHGRTKRRLLKTLAMTTASALGITLMAAPASAAQRCNYKPEYNACLSLTPTDSGHYLVHIGIDLRKLTQTEAQAIIKAAPYRNPFRTWLYAGDKAQDDIITGVSTIRVWASETGLSAEFERVVTKSSLNEDPWPGEFDEVYGSIDYRDPRTGSTRTFNTPEIAGLF